MVREMMLGVTEKKSKTKKRGRRTRQVRTLFSLKTSANELTRSQADSSKHNSSCIGSEVGYSPENREERHHERQETDRCDPFAEVGRRNSEDDSTESDAVIREPEREKSQ